VAAGQLVVDRSGLARSVGYVDSDGERVYFEVTGVGPPVVLCHGLGGNHAIWWRQIEAFAAEHQVITWDMRGFGNSTLASGEVGPVAARRDLRAVLDHLGLDRVTVLGQSLGGYVALGFALEHSDRVDALVLSTTLAGADPSYVERLRTAEPARDRTNRREHPVLSEQFCQAEPDLGVLYNQISSFGARPSPLAVLEAMVADTFSLPTLSTLAARTLVIMATDDPHCPPAALAPAVAAMPNARMVELSGGHSAYYENPAAWNSAVLNFLGEG
jgi:pimeloyl-ACP methyl ester carboxylesterase